MGGNADKTTRIDRGHQSPKTASARPDQQHPTQPPAKAARRVGMIAAWGRYPLLVARALKKQGYEVYCLAVVGEADPALAEVCHELKWSGPAKFDAAIRYLKRCGITQATMVGKFHKVKLFLPWRWLRYLPDWRTIRMFLPHFVTRRKDCRDDTLLGRIVEEFASEGIRLAPATDFVPELLIDEQQLTRRGPSDWQWKDIEFGWKVAKELGRLDIGQSVAVCDRSVLALEAVEGTDQCIARAGQFCNNGRFTVVKVAKPQQDMRFDVPTFGIQTLDTMIKAGAEVLAVEAGRTIILDQDKLIDYANRNKLIIVAVNNPSCRPTDQERSEAESISCEGAHDPEIQGQSRER